MSGIDAGAGAAAGRACVGSGGTIARRGGVPGRAGSGGNGVPSAPAQSLRSRARARSRPGASGSGPRGCISAAGTFTTASSRSIHASLSPPSSEADRNRTSVVPPSWRTASALPRTATSPVAVNSAIWNVRPAAIVAGKRSAPRSMPIATTAISACALANRVLTVTSSAASGIRPS